MQTLTKPESHQVEARLEHERYQAARRIAQFVEAKACERHIELRDGRCLLWESRREKAIRRAHDLLAYMRLVRLDEHATAYNTRGLLIDTIEDIADVYDDGETGITFTQTEIERLASDLGELFAASIRTNLKSAKADAIEYARGMRR